MRERSDQHGTTVQCAAVQHTLVKPEEAWQLAALAAGAHVPLNGSCRQLRSDTAAAAERRRQRAASELDQRTGGYGAGLGTLAAAAAVLVMARDELLCHGARSSSGTKVFGWHSLGLRLAPAEARPKSYETWMHILRDAPTCHDVAFSLRGATPELTANPSS